MAELEDDSFLQEVDAVIAKSKAEAAASKVATVTNKVSVLVDVDEADAMVWNDIQHAFIFNLYFIFDIDAHDLRSLKIDFIHCLEYLNHNQDKQMNPFAEDVFDEQMEPPPSASGMHRQEK